MRYIFDLKAIPDRLSIDGIVPIVRVTATNFASETNALCRGITAAFEVNPPTHDTFIGADPGTLYRIILYVWFINDDGEQEGIVSTPIRTLKPISG